METALGSLPGRDSCQVAEIHMLRPMHPCPKVAQPGAEAGASCHAPWSTEG